jgi:tartrate/fumarate subfamily iron-sulfur-dependent hydro-lyase alpha chain
VQVDGFALQQAIRRGCERATREYPLRSRWCTRSRGATSTRSCGIGVPVIHVDFSDAPDTLEIEMIPKGSGSENGSFLKMAIPAEGIDAIKTFVVDCVLAAGGKTCPPTIVGVGLGGTSDLVVALAKRAATRPLGSAAPTPTAQRWKRSCRPPSTSSASARRGWAAIPPRSRCTSNWRPRTSR